VALVIGLTSSIVAIVYICLLPLILQTYTPAWICWHLAYGHWNLIMIVFHYYMAITTSPGHPPQVRHRLAAQPLPAGRWGAATIQSPGTAKPSWWRRCRRPPPDQGSGAGHCGEGGRGVRGAGLGCTSLFCPMRRPRTASPASPSAGNALPPSQLAPTTAASATGRAPSLHPPQHSGQPPGPLSSRPAALRGRSPFPSALLASCPVSCTACRAGGGAACPLPNTVLALTLALLSVLPGVC